MNIHFDNLHSPEELRALSEALNKIADVREQVRAEFRLAAARDVPDEQSAPVQQETVEEKPAPKRTRGKPAAATATESQPSTETSSASTATTQPAAATAEPAAASSQTTATTSDEGNAAAASSAPEATAAPAASSSASVSLEQVRAKLASLSQAGKAADVKALIAKFGAAKLTDIPAAQYGEVLAAAEEI